MILAAGRGERLRPITDALPKALEKRQEQIDHVLTTMLMGMVREVDVREIVLEQLSTVTVEDLGDGHVNFLARRGQPRTLFNVHLDTVPIGNG